MTQGTQAGSWETSFSRLTIEDLDSATTYYFRVILQDDNNNFAMYEIVYGTTQGTDTAPPVITLNGGSTITITAGDDFTDPGAAAYDTADGDITASITVTGTVDNQTPGEYTLFYNVSDAAGNAAAEVTRTVTVTADTTVPVISLEGASELYINLNAGYNEPGYSAVDGRDGDITSEVAVSGTVDTSVTGITILSYNVTDADGNAAEPVTRRIIVLTADIIAPELTLLGAPLIYITQGNPFNDPGAEASDNYGYEDLTADITVDGSVDTSAADTYTLTYNVSDASGNAADPVERTVVVVPVSANIAPVADAGDDYSGDPGAFTISAAGSYDVNGDSLTYSWDVDSSPLGAHTAISSDRDLEFDLATAGTYEFTVTVSDAEYYTEASVTYTINNIAPIIRRIISYGTPLNMDETASAGFSCSTYDANYDNLNYLWEIASSPAGSSTAGLTGSTGANPTFTPDVAGTYIISLTIDDGEFSDYGEFVFDVYDNSQGGINVEIE